MDADQPTRRALPWCPAASLQRLKRTTAISCTLRLATKHYGNAEPINISLLEHQDRLKRLNKSHVNLEQTLDISDVPFVRYKQNHMVFGFNDGVVMDHDDLTSAYDRADRRARRKVDVFNRPARRPGSNSGRREQWLR